MRAAWAKRAVVDDSMAASVHEGCAGRSGVARPLRHPLGTVADVHDTVRRELTPVQQRTLEALRRTESPVVFDPAFVAELRADAARRPRPSSPNASTTTS